MLRRSLFRLTAQCGAMILTGVLLTGALLGAPAEKPFTMHLRTRDKATGAVTVTTAEWKPSETVIVICDMWDKHWCKHATARVAEMAPALNQTLVEARKRGVKILFAPSDVTKVYRAHPASKKMEKYGYKPARKWFKLHHIGAPGLPMAEGNGNGGGCEVCKEGSPWRAQIATLKIENEDYICEDQARYEGFLRDPANTIKNVVLCGVHTNMCILGRPFGIINSKLNGKNVALMRDLTDLMYNNPDGSKKSAPNVDHWAGFDLVVGHIEKHVAPSILSSDFTGKAPFRFKGDNRKPDKN